MLICSVLCGFRAARGAEPVGIGSVFRALSASDGGEYFPPAIDHCYSVAPFDEPDVVLARKVLDHGAVPRVRAEVDQLRDRIKASKHTKVVINEAVDSQVLSDGGGLPYLATFK